MPRTRNGLSFTQKLRLVKVLTAIAAKGEPVSRRDLTLRLAAEEPAAAQYLKNRSNLERLLEVTEFPSSLIAATARSRRERKGPKIRDLVEALSGRLSRIERELGITPPEAP